MIDDIWRTHQLFGLIFGAGLFSFTVSKTLGKAYALALFYSLASSIWLFQNPNEVWPGLMIRLDATSASAAIILVLVSAVAAFLKTEHVKTLLNFLAAVVYLNCFLVLFRGSGIFNAGSMDTATAALFLPTMVGFFYKNLAEGFKPFLLLPVIAIFSRHGQTGVILFCTIVFIYLWWTGRKKTVFALAGLLLPVVIYFSFRVYEKEMADRISYVYGRLFAWQEAFTWWGPNANLFFGTGAGSYQWIGPSIANRKTQVYLFLHNEYLQCLFEFGFLGLMLWGSVAWSAFKKSFTHPLLFTTFILLFIMSFTQYPCRFFLTQLAIVLWIRLARENKTPEGF